MRRVIKRGRISACEKLERAKVGKWKFNEACESLSYVGGSGY